MCVWGGEATAFAAGVVSRVGVHVHVQVVKRLWQYCKDNDLPVSKGVSKDGGTERERDRERETERERQRERDRERETERERESVCV